MKTITLQLPEGADLAGGRVPTATFDPPLPDETITALRPYFDAIVEVMASPPYPPRPVSCMRIGK